MARPTKLTKLVVQKLEDAFVLGATVEEACFNANIAKQTYYNWVEEKPELLDRFEALKMSPILKARKAVVDALESSPNLALKFLERRMKSEFGLNAVEQNHDTVIEMVIGGDDDADD